jgi:DUF4097 and DUF4098 domain-containing protein YvlB
MQRTFTTPEPISLFVELRSGELVVHTDDTGETVVEVTGNGADDVAVDQHGREVSVRAPRGGPGFFGSGSSLSVRVRLPHDSDLSAKLGSTDLRADGRLRDTTVKTGSGDLRFEELTGETSLESGSGDVTVAAVRGPLQVKSGSGDVVLDRVHAPVQVLTGSGNVSVASAEDTVTVKSGSGDMRVRDAHRDLSLNTASGDLVVDVMHRGQLSARNVSGDISVGVPAGVPVWTDVSTMTGSVTSGLAAVGEPADGQDHVEVRATTVSGDVELRQR